MKSVVGKPLDALQPFIGEWAVEGRHVAFPNAVIRGASVFEWWGDRTFLIHRASLDHPDFPDSISVMGATRLDGGLAQHYFDSRGVHRLFDMMHRGMVIADLSGDERRGVTEADLLVRFAELRYTAEMRVTKDLATSSQPRAPGA